MDSSATSRAGQVPAVVVLVAALLLALLPTAPAAHADSGLEADLLAAVNRERRAEGLAALTLASDLTTVARRHSTRMADQDHLHHNPALGSEVGGWQKLGENVGRGPSSSAIHDAFMASAGHRKNILDPTWTQIGIGVEVRGSRIWVTQIFRLPAGAEPEPTPEPEPAKEPEPAPPPGPSTSPPGDTGAPTGIADVRPPTRSAGEASSTAADRRGAAGAGGAAASPHPLTSTPVALDRMMLTLARLEASEGQRRLDDVLRTDRHGSAS